MTTSTVENQMSDNEIFAMIEQSDYPSTCDNCGETGTNRSMEQHLCVFAEELYKGPCSIGEHDTCIGRSRKWSCPCICHNRKESQ